MNVIILAAGEASRLGKLTKNIQKGMLSFSGRPAIDHLLSNLPKSDKIIVCIGPDFRGKLLRSYLLHVYPDTKFQFVVQEKAIGTANAMYLCLKDNSSTSAFICWSDLLLSKSVELPTESTIFTTDNFTCRYRFSDGKIEETTGNVCGMFFIKDPINITKLLETNQKCDFVDILKQSGEVFKQVSIDCLDFGVRDTLATTSNLSTSAHANITKCGDHIVKVYRKESSDIFEKESIWYAYAPQTVRRFIPNIYSVDKVTRTLEMECVQETSIDSVDDMRDFLANTIYVLDEYFHKNTYPAIKELIVDEYIKQPLERCRALVGFTPFLSDHQININGKNIDNPFWQLQDRYVTHFIAGKLTPTSFSFIHGDPTLQNIMQKNGKVCFIDPKAKFGNLWLYGDSKYDYAKLYYSVFGNYDRFNAGGYYLTVTDSGFEYAIDKPKFAELDSWYLDYLKTKTGINPHQIKLIHALIWLRLVGYILPQSIEQAIVAFLHGSVLLSEEL